MFARLTSFLHSLANRRQLEADWNAELDSHLELRAADLEGQGLSPDAARRQARLELGARETYREQCREARGLRLLDEFSADLRFAFRSLRHAPGFALVAISTLGLAIATNLAFFVFLDAFVLRPLPVRGADRYVDLEALNERGERTPEFLSRDLAALDVALAPAFEQLYGYTVVNLPVLAPVRRTVQAHAVSPTFLSFFNAVPTLGRWLLPDSDLAGGEREVVVLSHSGWARLFGRDPGVVGRQLQVAGRSLTVVGVMGREFQGVEAVVPDFWLSLSALSELPVGQEAASSVHLAGVLRPGVNTTAAAELATRAQLALGPRGDAGGGSSNEPVRVSVLPRRSRLSFEERRLVGQAGLVLSLAFLLVLLVACANLASLQLARAGARQREIATRLSLGSSRSRLVRQLMTESLVLALLALVLAAGLVSLASTALERYLFKLAIEAGITVVPVSPHWHSLVVALALALVAAFATGLLPALRATSPDLAAPARSAEGSGRPSRLNGFLIGAQVAASLVLLTVAALLVRNVESTARFDPGYSPAALVDVRFERPTAELVSKLSARADVAAVTALAFTPLAGPPPHLELEVAGSSQSLSFNWVDHHFFETIGIPLSAGRGFFAEEAAAAARVVVVSARTAAALWPGQNPLGAELEIRDPEGPVPAGRYSVVGVAADVVSGFLFQGRDDSMVYFPAVLGSRYTSNLVVRPRGDVAAFLRALPGVCAETDSSALCEPKTLAELGAMQRFPFLAGSLVASSLGLLALVLTAIGLYGLVAFAVVKRRREMGVRLALGATSGQLLSAVTRRALSSVAIGAVVGLPFCWLISFGARRLFTLLTPFDPATLLGAPLLLAAVAFLAALLPARRALATDPVESLRIS